MLPSSTEFKHLQMKIFAYLIPFLLFLSCKNASSNINENVDEIETQTTSIDEKQFLKKFEGKIGDFPIEMVLTNWGDGFMNGRYWYVKQRNPIEISGEMISEDAFEMTEYIDDQENGFFKGKIESPNLLKGIWTSLDKSKVYEFELVASPEKKPEDIWSGNWYLNEIWDGGILMMGNYTPDSIDFALTIFRSGHTGIAEGKAKFVQNKAIFYTDFYDEEEGCKLVFEHKGDHIMLEQRGSNFGCGFGMRAYASGRYDNQFIEKKAVLNYGEEEGNVFENQAQHDRFKTLIGAEKYDLFAFNMQIINVGELPEKNGISRKVVSGFVQGLFTTNEAIVVYDDQSNIWAATIDVDDSTDEFVVRYFTNDESKSENLPEAINEWRENFMEYPVVFESKKMENSIQ